MKPQKQYQIAKMAWEERTGKEVVTVRLDKDVRELLNSLKDRYGGRAKAIAEGLRLLEQRQRDSDV